ncbi:MAG: PIN domain-containing protein [Chitinispirillales bacterium]|jgi:predicted nucleic acid-binding protein|nr:PIN domain-containing protein [Chitinispirillales bacterium]
MSVLTVLIDTDVLIDSMTNREPFTRNAKDLIDKSHKKAINAYLAPHSISNIFYILRKVYSVSERKQALFDLCQSVSIAFMGKEAVFNALTDENFDDIEDGLQAECAKAVNADYIVTRDIEDYIRSPIPAISPGDLLERI